MKTRKAIAIIISIILVFLPVLGNAVIDIFKSSEMKNKVFIERYASGNGDFLIRISHIDGTDSVVRTLTTTIPRKKMPFNTYIDATLRCENLNDENTCEIKTVSADCTKDHYGKDDCFIGRSNFSGEDLKKYYPSKDFLNIPQQYFLTCKSIITKEKAEQLNIALETKGKSFLQILAAIPLFVTAVALPVAGMVLGPATNGISTAVTNVVMGAGTNIASEVTAGIGNKIITDNPDIQGQNLPECITETTVKKETQNP
ncbi:MAG: hypothetical protein A2X55_08915 [Nitrospirae bacterium GWB2_47_37]|nr:MAG: hypothetical protein A2X55_08915 [Nitrospirae bacterium GWB2_47_37]HAK87632.1 hypothetical protein [Nitrospiraceae bacterium]